MSSNIVYTTIDEQFPIAGQDNDSQGFRDNFNIIKENFRNAIIEIEDLQNNAVTKNVDNIFTDAIRIKFARLQAVYEESNTDAFTNGIVTAANVSFLTGHHQVIKAEGDINLTFTDWPTSGKYAEVRVQLFSDGTERNVTFLTEDSGEFRKDGNSEWTGTTVTIPNTETTSKLIKAWTYDGGATVYLDFVGTYTA